MSGRNTNGNPEQGAGQDDDDDFGEFGGFEAADPMEAMSAAVGQAAASPWAAIATASAAGRRQPDLLCPQNSFPPYLDPSGIAGSPLHAGADNLHADGDRLEGDPPLFDAHFDNGDPLQQRVVAERSFPADGVAPLADVLDGTFDSSAAHSRGAGAASYPANGMLPDIGLGTNRNSLFAERPVGVDVSQNAQSPEEAAPVVAEVAAEADGNLDNRALREAERVEGEAEDGGVDGERQVAAPAAEAAIDEAAQSRVERELASLQSSNLILNQQLQRTQDDLAAQRSRLQEVQQQHAELLEAARQSGHDALTVVVEQYKELSRTVVLEQQEASQRHLVEVMEQQLQTFQRALQARREEEERERNQAKQQMQEELSTTLETLRTELQGEFDRHLAEERQRQEAAIKQAMEEERSRCEELMREAIAAEQSKALEQLEKTKEEYSQQLEEQKRHYVEMLREQCREERNQAQERLSACLEEERQRGREMTDTALQDARVEREAYVQQQRQSDAALRRRQLASLDLFLESARRQVDLLLNPETPPPPAAPHPPPPPDERQND